MQKTDGIVLHSRDINRGTRVITVLTKEFGIVDAFANGARNAKSKLISGTQPFAYCDFIFTKKGEYITVNSAETKKIFYGLRDDVEKLSLGFYLSDITRHVAPKAEKADEYLKLFLNTLHFLELGKMENDVLKAIYELRIFSIAGYMPNIVGCEECGSFEEEYFYFFPTTGLVLCSKCLLKTEIFFKKMKISFSTLSAMRYVIYSDISKLFAFEISGQGKEDFIRACETYILEQGERMYKTLDFYKSMKA